MATRGLIDPELDREGVVDPELNRLGLVDAELSTATSSVTVDQEVGIFVQQASSQMVGVVYA